MATFDLLIRYAHELCKEIQAFWNERTLLLNSRRPFRSIPSHAARIMVVVFTQPKAMRRVS